MTLIAKPAWWWEEIDALKKELAASQARVKRLEEALRSVDVFLEVIEEDSCDYGHDDMAGSARRVLREALQEDKV